MTCPLRFLTLKRFFSESVLIGAFSFLHILYGKVAIDHIPKTRRPETFHREVIGEDKQKTSEIFRSNRRS